MRLICPNCDAEYEVDDNLIPAEGRDVQCSNCTTTWFQAAPEADEDEDVPAPAAPEVEESADDSDDEEAAILPPAAGSMPPRKPTVDPAAMEIIHEEVERETAAREAERGGLETQPDLGLDGAESEDHASAARDRVARRRGLDAQSASVDDDDTALAAAPKREETSAKKELFPDIEEINSTLSPEAAEAEAEAARLAAEGGETEQTERSSFRLGFGLMLLLAVALMLVYVYAPQIARSFPALSDTLQSYVTTVDSIRVGLDTAAQGLVEKIGVTLDGQS
ncbi:zinc-ribbon domain-containing protein [Litoreibacter arenae]|uniref:Zinc finger/thioredoxin putative domain-containing protein n=1 Tax=Litoreibacter arenae DSM 19593 TaxID=1123360 RepID=S9QAG1_9RHOB|nr:zinc-ribbon domain-containing protein [Litoreibacter arenae]EPX76982.1 hypothetical protein thalar_02701 [Litoreibacter arenae DSM 19593]